MQPLPVLAGVVSVRTRLAVVGEGVLVAVVESAIPVVLFAGAPVVVVSVQNVRLAGGVAVGPES